MRKIKLIIGDEEENYAEKLTSYIRKEEAGNIDASWYVDKEQLLEHQSGKEPTIFLLGSEFLQEEYLMRLFLPSSQRILVLLTQDATEKRLAQYPVIHKYQPAKEVIRQIYQLAEEYIEDDTVWTGNKQRMTGVLAPWNYELSMLFSLVVAQIFGEEQRVLYVSLQECYGIERFMEASIGRNLIDIISVLRKQHGNPGATLKSVVTEMGKADYLPPADNPQNLFEMTAEDYRSLILTIKEQSDYDLILWESGMMGHGMIAWMEQCQVIYCPYQEELFLTEQKRQIEHILSLHERPELFSKLQFVRLPHISFPSGMDVKLAQLPWSQLGTYVREQVLMHGI